MEVFNGYSQILRNHVQSISVYSDASDFGFGACFNNDWFLGAFQPVYHNNFNILPHHVIPFDPCCINTHINVKEMFAVITAAGRRSPLWRNKRLVFITDNNTVRAALCSGKTPNHTILQWIKELFWLSVMYNYEIAAVYINSDKNLICDALSHWDNKSSKASIRAADPGNRLCCYNLFTDTT